MSHELPPRFSSGSDESSPGAGDSGKKVEKGTKRKIPKENPKKRERRLSGMMMMTRMKSRRQTMMPCQAAMMTMKMKGGTDMG